MGLFDLFKKKKPQAPFVAFTLVEKKRGSSDAFLARIQRKSTILLVIGKRGSGKTALGFRFLELFHYKTKKECSIVGYADVKLPSWIKKIKDVKDAKENSTVLIDEGALAFSARESMKDANKMIGNIMAIARHKNLTLIFISQNSAMIVVNVLRLVDTLILKEPSLLQSRFERKALRDIYDEIKHDFKLLEDKASHFFVYDDDFQGMMSAPLPSFWTESVSTSYKNK
jgi:hypothetical protein